VALVRDGHGIGGHGRDPGMASVVISGGDVGNDAVVPIFMCCCSPGDSCICAPDEATD
jgi:hypothetical protein